MGVTRIVAELDENAMVRLVITETKILAGGERILKTIGLDIIQPERLEGNAENLVPVQQIWLGTKAVDELLELLKENV